MWFGDKELTPEKVTQALKNEFERRKQSNPQYSMRAYASYLGIDHSALSKILRGERTLSWQIYQQIHDKVPLEDHQQGST